MNFIDSAEPQRLTPYVDSTFLTIDEAPISEIINPQDGSVVAEVVEASAADIDRVVMAGKVAFSLFRRQPTHYRIALLKSAARAINDMKDDIASMICTDVGKPIRVASFEVFRTVEYLEGCASALTQFGGETLPLDIAERGAGHIGFVRHVPYGVVAAITPFNAPLNLLVEKVAPAIAAGNAVVVKPHPAGTRIALYIARLLESAGWPQNLFTVVTGDREAASALVAHPDIHAITFTGSTTGGDALARLAGAKKFVAELGSNAANIVLADADIDKAAQKIAAAAFEASGQQCISAQRILLARPVWNAFLDVFVAAAGRMVVGRADDPRTDLGPLVSVAAAERVMSMCEDAIARGARYVLEPRKAAATLSPGILVDVPHEARLWCEEVFGPVAIVSPFDSVDEAVQLANDTPFGLQGAVFTRDLAAVLRFSDEFDVGGLWFNEASRFRLNLYPFGGVKRSGVGREGVRHAIEELSQLKFIGLTI